nr:hypothetical protein [Tanacetum cinerariifolium]
MIIAGADNRPPMLEKSLYDSWKSHMKLCINNREDDRMILNSIQNGPLAMALLTAVASSRFLSTNNQLRTTSNPRNQGNATIFEGNSEGGHARVVRYYDRQGEGHMARQYTQPKRPRNAAWFKEKAMLTEAQESGQVLNEEQLAFLADPAILDGQAAQTTIPNVVVSRVRTLMLMILTVMMSLMQRRVISSQRVVIPVIDDEEILILEEVSRSKMVAKQNDPIYKENKLHTTPINYVKLNRMSKDFGKRFVPQQELSAGQAFWLQTSNHKTDQSDISPVKIKAPRELPKRVRNGSGDVKVYGVVWGRR